MRFLSRAGMSIGLLILAFGLTGAAETESPRNIKLTISVERQADDTVVKSYEILTLDGGAPTSLDATERVPMSSTNPSGPVVSATTIQSVGFQAEVQASRRPDGLIHVGGSVFDVRLGPDGDRLKSFRHTFEVVLDPDAVRELLKFDDPNAGAAVLKLRASPVD